MNDHMFFNGGKSFFSVLASSKLVVDTDFL